MTQLDELKHEAKTRRRNGAVVTMAVLAVLLLGVGVFAAFPRSSEPITPPPPPAVAVRPQVGSLEPGRYSVFVHSTTPIRAELTLSEPGWSYESWNGLAHFDEPLSGMMLWLVDSIFTDVCGFGTSDEGLPDGYTPAQLVAVLETQEGTDLSTPTQTTVGGYPAIRVDIVSPAPLDVSCRSWKDGLGGTRRASGDLVSPLWIVDVAGTTVVIDAMGGPVTPALQGIVDSITFTGQ